jgi:hypothetical protein
MSREGERRRNRERLAGAGLAVLGAAVLVVALIALRDPNGGKDPAAGTQVAGPSTSHVSSSPAPSPTKTPSTHASTTPAGSSTPAGSTPLPTKTTLVVLNNTTTTGLAQQAAARFTAGGWTVSKYANYTNDIISTCAYYDPNVPGAQSAALTLQSQYPTIRRVQPQFTELAVYNSPIVVILTSDYSPN